MDLLGKYRCNLRLFFVTLQQQTKATAMANLHVRKTSSDAAVPPDTLHEIAGQRPGSRLVSNLKRPLQHNYSARITWKANHKKVREHSSKLYGA